MGNRGRKYGDLKRSTKNSITEMHIREHYKGVAELYTFFIHFIYIYLLIYILHIKYLYLHLREGVNQKKSCNICHNSFVCRSQCPGMKF